MARQSNSNLHKMGDLIYDKKEKAFYQKVTDPSMLKAGRKEKENRNLREGNIEFGGGAVLSKVLRDKLASLIVTYNDRALAGRLTGIFRSMIKRGSGIKGMRNAEIRENNFLLEGFQFHKRNFFNRIFHAELNWQVSKGRKEIVLTIPAFNAANLISEHKYASHFQIRLVVVVLPNYQYSKTKKRYLPVASSFDDRTLVESSDYFPLNGRTEEIRIRIALKSKLPDACAMIVCTGIQFFQVRGSDMYSLESNRALEISKVL